MFFPYKNLTPSNKIPYLTITLILLNSVVYFYQNLIATKSFDHYLYSYSLIPWEISHFQNADVPVRNHFGGVAKYFSRNTFPPFSMLSSMFMHASLLHILCNMYFLWIFGGNIEERLGIFRFLLLYLLSGIIGDLAFVAFHTSSLVPMIGASGAVSGVMGAYMIWYPRSRIRTLVFLIFLITSIDIPALAFLLLWFLAQLLFAGGGEGIAWQAHIGGFITGLILAWIFKKRIGGGDGRTTC